VGQRVCNVGISTIDVVVFAGEYAIEPIQDLVGHGGHGRVVMWSSKPGRGNSIIMIRQGPGFYGLPPQEHARELILQQENAYLYLSQMILYSRLQSL